MSHCALCKTVDEDFRESKVRKNFVFGLNIILLRQNIIANEIFYVEVWYPELSLLFP